MMLPILILPFVILLFIIFGGGNGNAANVNVEKTAGLNLQLPDAHFKKKKEADKLGLYEVASLDSDKRREALKNDPYRKERMDSDRVDAMSFDRSPALKNILDKTAAGFPEKDYQKLNTTVSARTNSDVHEKELKDKMALLQEIIKAKPVKSSESQDFYNPKNLNRSSDRVSMILKDMNNSPATDPELSQLNTMLDKVMAIQHPEMGTDSLRHFPDTRKATYAVETINKENAVTATIPERQTLVTGATIRLQLTEAVRVGGIQVEPDQFLYGTGMLSNERLKVEIRSIRVGNNILPVDLELYDLDGMEGIYVPGSISRDVSKQSFDQGMSRIGITSLDPSIGAEAASAGIQAAKTLISRKVKLIQVTIPNGYQVLLKNAH